VRLGHAIAGLPEPPRPARTHFDIPGSTHGFTAEVDEKRGSLVGLHNQQLPGGSGALQVAFRKLNKKGEARLFRPNNLEPIRAKFRTPTGLPFRHSSIPAKPCELACRSLPGRTPLSAALYAWDENNQKRIQGLVQALYPGEWQELQLNLPPMHGACLSQAGVVFRNVGDEVWNGSILLDELDWDGSPNYSDDFANARPAAGSIHQWTYLRGYWRLQDGAYHGSGPFRMKATQEHRWSI
jgi:hypothetical protein